MGSFGGEKGGDKEVPQKLGWRLAAVSGDSFKAFMYLQQVLLQESPSPRKRFIPADGREKYKSCSFRNLCYGIL